MSDGSGTTNTKFSPTVTLVSVASSLSISALILSVKLQSHKVRNRLSHIVRIVHCAHVRFHQSDGCLTHLYWYAPLVVVDYLQCVFWSSRRIEARARKVHNLPQHSGYQAARHRRQIGALQLVSYVMRRICNRWTGFINVSVFVHLTKLAESDWYTGFVLCLPVF